MTFNNQLFPYSIHSGSGKCDHMNHKDLEIHGLAIPDQIWDVGLKDVYGF